jgi:hypothetical protein
MARNSRHAAKSSRVAARFRDFLTARREFRATSASGGARAAEREAAERERRREVGDDERPAEGERLTASG